ncbi:MAG: DNA-binding response regulator [Mangrovibacterium sp.]
MNIYSRFIIADNQDLSRAGLSFIIAQNYAEAEVKLVSTPEELELQLQQNSVVVFDLHAFPFQNQTQFAQLKASVPHCSWILFSNQLPEGLIQELSQDQSLSMVLKSSSQEEIRSALQCAIRGTRFLCHEVTNSLLSSRQQAQASSSLTSTELEVLKLIAYGKSVKEIAAYRHSSTHTISTHKKNIFRKLGINSVHDATKYALKENLIEMMEYYI